MADKKISQLTAAAALTGSEPIPTVQGGVTVQTTAQDIADLAAGGSSLLPNGIKIITESRELQADDAGYFLVLVASSPESPVILTIPEPSPLKVNESFAIINGGDTENDKNNGFRLGDTESPVSNAAITECILFTTTKVEDINTSFALSTFIVGDGNEGNLKTALRYLMDNVGRTGTATLVAGTVTVADDRVRTGAKIIVSVDTPGGTQGFLSAPVASIVDETSFVINSSSATETSTINYWFVNP
jgi:hypothetical protein